MEQLPLTFNQATVEPDIQECYEPAFNFTRVNSSNGRLAFTADKIYWLPDAPMAMLDQGWVIRVNEVESCAKYGISGFLIKLKDGKDLRFSNVGSKHPPMKLRLSRPPQRTTRLLLPLWTALRNSPRKTPAPTNGWPCSPTLAFSS